LAAFPRQKGGGRNVGNSTEGRFLLVNQQGIIGRSRKTLDEVLGKTDFDFVDFERAEKIRVEEQAIMQSGVSLINQEESAIFRPRSERRWFITTKIPFRDSAGNIVGLVGVSRDITERRQAEEALQASNDRLSALISALPDQVIIFDEDGRYLDMHNEFSVSYPYQQSPINRRLHDVEEVVDEVADLVLKTIRQAIESNALQTVEYLSHGVLYEWIEGRAVPLQRTVNGKRTVLWLTRDITERKQAEQEREQLLVAEREQRQFSETLRDTVNIINSSLDLDEILIFIVTHMKAVVPHDGANIMLIDMETETIRVVHYCDCYAQHGLPEPILNEPMSSTKVAGWIQMIESKLPILIPDTLTDPGWTRLPEADWIRSYAAAPILVGGEVFGLLNLDSATPNFFSQLQVERLQVFAGQVAIALENARLYDTVSRYADELEQRVLDRTARLQQTTDRVTAILNSSSDGIILTDPDGTIRQTNPAFGKLYDYDVDEAFGQPLTILVASESIDPLTKSLHSVVKSRESTRIELIGHHKDGHTFDVAMGLSTVRQDTAVTGIVCMAHDITQRKQLEHNLHAMLEKERELGELKSRFVSMASHEFRTPLAVIQTSSDLLSRYADEITEERKQQSFQQIKRQIVNLTRIIDGVLSIGRTQAGKTEFTPTLIDLEPFCRNVFDQIQFTDTSEHQFEFINNAPDKPVMIDGNLLSHILTNLLTNAVKYSPERRKITFELDHDDQNVIFKVSDEGIGIPEEDLTRLFEPFHRASNVGEAQGTGLGLSIVKEYVELHGGSIEVESEMGKGSTFRILLPMA
jgi:PAS domain S-box-containing protein